MPAAATRPSMTRFLVLFPLGLMVGFALLQTGWGFGTLGGGFIVCVVCPNNATLSPGPTVTPSHLIIGPGPYSNANGSIAGNGPHNPFLDQTATFVITDPGITSATTVSDVVFSFGTQPGVDVPGGSGPPPPPPPPVPEPASAILGGVGLATLGLFRRHLRAH